MLGHCHGSVAELAYGKGRVAPLTVANTLINEISTGGSVDDIVFSRLLSNERGRWKINDKYCFFFEHHFLF